MRSLGRSRSPKDSEIGFMTLAVGLPDYAEMAVDMALSLREWHDEPLAIAVDAPMEAYIAKRYPTVFDTVVRLPATVPPGWGCKLAIAEVSPFLRTVFVDADVIVLGSLDTVLADAERADFAMMGEYHTAPTSERHNGVPMEAVIRDFGLSRYFHNHSCNFVFERDYGRRFLAECLDVWLNRLSSPSRRPFEGFGDEVAFGIVAARRGMVSMREPYPVYWPAELHALRSNDRWKPLLHLYDLPPHRVMKWLMTEVVARRREARFGNLSIGHWLRKPARKSLSRGWLTVLRNCDVRLHAAWHAGRVDRRGDALKSAAAPRAAIKSVGKESPPAGIGSSSSNLLLHATQRRQAISTPHIQLAIDETGLRDSDVPMALAIHCWPDAPMGLRASVGWLESKDRSAVEIGLTGPLPEARDAVLCIRFRGHPAKALDPALALLANLRSNLVSPGTLQNSVLAVGVGGDYLASASLDETSRRFDCSFAIAPRQWPADSDELFLELRLATAGLAQSSGAVKIEVSHFYLGQDAHEGRFGELTDTAMPNSRRLAS
jgi:hypothetical protein